MDLVLTPLPLMISNISGGYDFEFGYDDINSIPYSLHNTDNVQPVQLP